MKIKLNKLDRDFIVYWNKLKKQYGEDIEFINGLHNENLNFNGFIDNFIDSNNVADATIDDNANASVKDIRSLLDEMSKSHQKLLSFNKIFYELKKKYGLATAQQWLENEWNGALYLHDSATSSWYAYCYAYELEDLVNKGLFFLPKTNTAPAKHLSTFAAHLREFIVYVSNRSSGACALPSFFIYSYYFWKKDVEEKYSYASDPEYYREQFFQQFIFEVNQIHTRIIQSAYTNLMIMDRNYITAIFGDRIFPDGSLVIDHIEDIIEHQKVFMRTLSKVRKEIFLTFPVITYSLLFQEGKFVDEEFAIWANKHNMEWYDGNFYVGDTVTHLSSCCRMLNDISKQKQFQSSIGGSLVEIGSVKVSTINLMRIALESQGDKERFIEILKERVHLNIKLLDTIRSIIQRNIEKKLLPNYESGLMKLEKQTTTNGLTAMFEAIKELNMVKYDEFGNVYYTDEGIEFASRVMDTVNEIQDNLDYDYQVSLEIVPAESANVKLCKKDNILYNRQKNYIYSNQWIGMIDKCTLTEKIKLSSILDKKAGGGQILHIGLGDKGKFNNEKQAWDMLNHIAKQGVIYFAYNPKLSLCDNSHCFFGEVCPTCGGLKTDEASRIVGYLVATKSYSKDRKREYDNRQWYDVNI